LEKDIEKNETWELKRAGAKANENIFETDLKIEKLK
jgi:hypothetical protein